MKKLPFIVYPLAFSALAFVTFLAYRDRVTPTGTAPAAFAAPDPSTQLAALDAIERRDRSRAGTNEREEPAVNDEAKPPVTSTAE